MNFFLNELRIVPRLAWPIALLVAGGSSAWFLMIPNRPRVGTMEAAFLLWGGLFLFSWVVLIGYINADARRRGMRHIMWTLLTIFIPYGIGAILYFVLREPMLVSCPKCGARGRPAFVFCPKCGSELAPSCPSCKRAVELEWNLCAYCGRPLDAQTAEPPLQKQQ